MSKDELYGKIFVGKNILTFTVVAGSQIQIPLADPNEYGEYNDYFAVLTNDVVVQMCNIEDKIKFVVQEKVDYYYE